MANTDDESGQLDLEGYIKQGEPEQSEKTLTWKTAIGLQDVDGLKISEYLLATAKEHIEGKIDIKTAQRRLQTYYQEKQTRDKIEEGTREADIVPQESPNYSEKKAFSFRLLNGKRYTEDYLKEYLIMQANIEPTISPKVNGCLMGKQSYMLRPTAFKQL